MRFSILCGLKEDKERLAEVLREAAFLAERVDLWMNGRKACNQFTEAAEYVAREGHHQERDSTEF